MLPHAHRLVVHPTTVLRNATTLHLLVLDHASGLIHASEGKGLSAIRTIASSKTKPPFLSPVPSTIADHGSRSALREAEGAELAVAIHVSLHLFTWGR